MQSQQAPSPPKKNNNQKHQHPNTNPHRLNPSSWQTQICKRHYLPANCFKRNRKEQSNTWKRQRIKAVCCNLHTSRIKSSPSLVPSSIYTVKVLHHRLTLNVCNLVPEKMQDYHNGFFSAEVSLNRAWKHEHSVQQEIHSLQLRRVLSFKLRLIGCSTWTHTLHRGQLTHCLHTLRVLKNGVPMWICFLWTPYFQNG